MNKDKIVEELKEIIFDYQDTMTKDVEQSIKNLISQIEVSNNNWPEGLGDNPNNGLGAWNGYEYVQTPEQLEKKR